MQEPIQLVAPNGCPIAGVRADDGSVRSFTYSYSRASKVRLFVLDDGSPVGDAVVTLVDANGVAWNSSEVEYYTLFKNQASQAKWDAGGQRREPLLPCCQSAR